MREHFHDYLGVTSYLSLEQIMPIFLLGFVGLFFLKRQFRKERVLLVALFIVHLFYLLNIQTIGHCQFGPRYLIPLIYNLNHRYEFIHNRFLVIPYAIGAFTIGILGLLWLRKRYAGPVNRSLVKFN
jgi:hypothetical protein